MKNFKNYSSSLLQYIQDGSRNNRDNWNDIINLDTIDLTLRSYLSVEEMKEAGSFFTGQALASEAVNRFSNPINANSRIIDPACGAGNLLIECSRHLEIGDSLSDTLAVWGKVIWGFDIHESFVDCTKIRIVIEALSRGCKLDCSIDDAISLLKNISVKDAMSVTKSDVDSMTHLIINPPFTNWKPGKNHLWGDGKVNAAAVIFDFYLDILPNNCDVCAILPEVIRSGARYQALRASIEKRLQAKCEVWGRFNAKTDVDVFVLYGRKQQSSQNIFWQKNYVDFSVLAEKFDVFIGPLVAYRDKEEGLEYPYLHAKNCIRGKEIIDISETRKFQGKVIEAPFVVIKRTSSPSDKVRASASLIIDNRSKIAVENHLIVVKPKDGSLEECRKLLKVLETQFVNDYFNDTIRMRHLTVQSIKNIPYID